MHELYSSYCASNFEKTSTFLKKSLPNQTLTQELLDVLIDMIRIGRDLTGVFGGGTILKIARGKNRTISHPLLGKYQSTTLTVAELDTLAYEAFFNLPMVSKGSFGPDHCFSKYEMNKPEADKFIAWLESNKLSLPSGGPIVKGTFVAPTQDFSKINKALKKFLHKQEASMPSSFPGTELLGVKVPYLAHGCIPPKFEWRVETKYFSKQVTTTSTLLKWRYFSQCVALTSTYERHEFILEFSVDKKDKVSLSEVNHNVTNYTLAGALLSNVVIPCPNLLRELQALWLGKLP